MCIRLNLRSQQRERQMTNHQSILDTRTWISVTSPVLDLRQEPLACLKTPEPHEDPETWIVPIRQTRKVVTYSTLEVGDSSVGTVGVFFVLQCETMRCNVKQLSQIINIHVYTVCTCTYCMYLYCICIEPLFHRQWCCWTRQCRFE